MATVNNRVNRKKSLPALIFAFGMTGLIGVVMLAVGINVVFKNQVTTALAAPAPTEVLDIQALSIEELRDLVVQYQSREAQYQAELVQAADQLTQANSEVQSYQSLITELERLGLIQVDGSGQVTVLNNAPQSITGFNGNEHEENEGFWGDDD